MAAQRYIFSALLLPMALLLTACPSDPSREVPKTQKYKPGIRVVDPDNDQWTCPGKPFYVNVENQRDSLLEFKEESASSYKILIRNAQLADFQVQATKVPRGMRVQSIDNKPHEKTYQVSWTPDQHRREDRGHFILHFTAPSCYGTETIPFVVYRSVQQVTIELRDVPRTVRNLGQTFNFTVDVTDDAATKEMPPRIAEIKFKKAASSGERPVLDASPATTCSDVPRQVREKIFRYQCTVDTAKIAGINDASLAGKIVEGVVFISAESRRSNRSTASDDLRVEFRVNVPRAPTTQSTSPGAGL